MGINFKIKSNYKSLQNVITKIFVFQFLYETEGLWKVKKDL